MFKIALTASLLAISAFSGSMHAQSPSTTMAPPTDVVAWVLGTKLGMAAVGSEAGASEKVVSDLMATANALADALGTQLPELPKRSGKSKSEFAADVLHFMTKEVDPVCQHLAKKYNKRHAEIFEIAMKSSALAIVYVPGNSEGLTVANVVEEQAKQCELPEKLWKPFVDSIRRRESYEIVVKAKMREMHTATREHLLASK